jgi:twinkle protein
MANPQRGVDFLDQAANRHIELIRGEEIDWNRWLTPDDHTRIIPAEALAERGKASMLLGDEAEPGLTLPWEKTKDKVLIRPGKLCVWAGWSRHGKTQLLKQLMLHGIAQGEKPLVASMEEEVLEVWKDLAWIACGEKNPKVKTINEFCSFVGGKLWLYDQQGQINPRRMQAVIRYAASELKITQVVVDSLMMLALDRDDYEAQARFVGELKSVAKDTGVTVHLVAHMRKRDGKGGDEQPGTLHDISGGHEIGSKADYVFIVWRDIQRKDASGPQAILKVEKQRGRVNWLGTVGLGFHDGARQFVEDVHPMRFWDEPGQNF